MQQASSIVHRFVNSPSYSESERARAENIHLECSCPACQPRSREPWTRGEYHQARQESIEAFEYEYVSALLVHTDGNISEAARVGGINRATLYRLMERHVRPRRHDR